MKKTYYEIRIPTKLLWEACQKYSDTSVEKVYGIESKDITVLILILLFRKGKISRKQFCLYMSRYHSNTLDRYVKLYHSRINDKWYEEHTFGAILIKVLKGEILDPYSDLDIPLHEYLGYLNLGFSRNKNWCVDYIAMAWLRPMIEYCYEHKRFKLLNTIDPSTDYRDMEDCGNLSAGYYEDPYDYCSCDKDERREYALSNYIENYMVKKKDCLSTIGKIMLTYKTHLENPNCVISDGFMEESLGLFYFSKYLESQLLNKQKHEK